LRLLVNDCAEWRLWERYELVERRPRQRSEPRRNPEWIESLKAVIDAEGAERAHQLLEGMVGLTRRSGAYLPFSPTTEYVNTIAPQREAKSPGDAAMEWRIRSLIRWNAMATVVRANRKPGDLGGHIASFASAATLYDVGFNHFWRAPERNHPGDLLFIQGHSAPGIYARAFLEGRIGEDSWTASAWKWTATACRRTRTRG
jgi:pyruvate dehydrogenase E1 component